MSQELSTSHQVEQTDPAKYISAPIQRILYRKFRERLILFARASVETHQYDPKLVEYVCDLVEKPYQQLPIEVANQELLYDGDTRIGFTNLETTVKSSDTNNRTLREILVASLNVDRLNALRSLKTEKGQQTKLDTQYVIRVFNSYLAEFREVGAQVVALPEFPYIANQQSQTILKEFAQENGYCIFAIRQGLAETFGVKDLYEGNAVLVSEDLIKTIYSSGYHIQPELIPLPVTPFTQGWCGNNSLSYGDYVDMGKTQPLQPILVLKVVDGHGKTVRGFGSVHFPAVNTPELRKYSIQKLVEISRKQKIDYLGDFNIYGSWVNTMPGILYKSSYYIHPQYKIRIPKIYEAGCIWAGMFLTNESEAKQVEELGLSLPKTSDGSYAPTSKHSVVLDGAIACEAISSVLRKEVPLSDHSLIYYSAVGLSRE
jgi:hypothetical protein